MFLCARGEGGGGASAGARKLRARVQGCALRSAPTLDLWTLDVDRAGLHGPLTKQTLPSVPRQVRLLA